MLKQLPEEHAGHLVGNPLVPEHRFGGIGVTVEPIEQSVSE